VPEEGVRPGCSFSQLIKYLLSSWLFPSVLVGVVVLDQWAKLAVRARLSIGQRVPLIDGILSVTLTMNTGIAFGLLADNDHPHKLLFLTIGAVIAIAIFTWFSARYGGKTRMVAISVALLIGGTLGNVIDRMSWGAVIDFVDLHWGQKVHWPAFNVADAAVSIATLLMIIRIASVGFGSGASGQSVQDLKPDSSTACGADT